MRTAALFIAVFAAASSPAAANGVAAVADCVDARAADGLTCLGVVTDPCVARPGGETTLGIVECVQNETAAWDSLLNRFYKQLRQTEEEPARTTLRDAQRAWIKWRDADCAFAYEQFLGGSLRSVTGAFCLRDRTAERVMHLHGYLNYGN